MNLEVLLPLAGAAGAIAAVVFAALKFQREDAGQTVAQQAQVVTSMQVLIDELQEALEQCRTERKQLETNLRACVHEQQRLEQQLIDLGEDPHA